MTMLVTFRGLTLLVSLAALSCRHSAIDEPPNANFRVSVEVESDPGKPLGGVELKREGRTVARTDDGGRATITVNDVEGAVLEYTVACPRAYQSPDAPIRVTLRRFVERTLAPTYTIRCPPRLRILVAAIRAENGRNLPVTYLGREVARTDDEGIAHVVVEAAPGEGVELTLVTDVPEGEHLRPQNPPLNFAAKDYDEYVALEQKFTLEKPKVRVVAAPHIVRPKRL